MQFPKSINKAMNETKEVQKENPNFTFHRSVNCTAYYK